jgi:hypothetical protein
VRRPRAPSFALLCCAVVVGCNRERSGASADADSGSAAPARTDPSAGAPGASADPRADRPRYRSIDGNFEVSFPGTSEPKLETRPILSGVEYVTKTQGELGTFLVGYDDTLKLAEPRAAKRVLDDVVKSTMAANHGKAERTTALTLAGKHPGRAFESSFLSKDKKRVRGYWRLYVVKTRVYQVVALTEEDKPLSDRDQRSFFDSFALLTPR